MSVIIIDYPLPESIANRTDYEGKFLQLRWRGQEYAGVRTADTASLSQPVAGSLSY